MLETESNLVLRNADGAWLTGRGRLGLPMSIDMDLSRLAELIVYGSLKKLQSWETNDPATVCQTVLY